MQHALHYAQLVDAQGLQVKAVSAAALQTVLIGSCTSLTQHALHNVELVDVRVPREQRLAV